MLQHGTKGNWKKYENNPVLGGKYGIHFERVSDQPVLLPEEPWEKAAVMCPSVLWDEETGRYKMWYSAGEQYEPNAIGYAESPDGLVWQKFTGNPIFCADPDTEWEQHKAAGCQVLKKDEHYYMFILGIITRITHRLEWPGPVTAGQAGDA